MKLSLPSPLQQIHLPLFAEKKLSVFVKRDDLIHPLISGNKWRKLKYLLQKARLVEKQHLITFGGAFSNHLLATAVAAQAEGFKSTGIVRGEKVSNHMLSLCLKMGMQLIFTDRESYREKTSLFNQYFLEDETAFFIDEGGSSPEAVQGCAEMLDELTESFDHIFCAAGTATTAAGIYSGIKNKNWSTQLHVVPALKDGAFLQQEIEKYIETDDRLHFHADFHFGGYAKVNDELLKFIISYYHETGILLDPVYTGKLLFALHQLIETDTFSPGSRILWVHSGGLFGLLGMKEKFQQLDPDFTQNLAQLIPKQF